MKRTLYRSPHLLLPSPLHHHVNDRWRWHNCWRNIADVKKKIKYEQKKINFFRWTSQLSYLNKIHKKKQKSERNPWIWLGTFVTLEMAAHARDVTTFSITIKGSSTILNFPELVGSLPRRDSNSPDTCIILTFCTDSKFHSF